MASDTKVRSKPGKSRMADGFVMMAMAVVTLALCMGLVAQAGLSFWLAVTVSAAFYVGLLTLHTLVRRHDQLDELRTEVDRLTGEVARLYQFTASGPPSRPAHAPAAAPSTRGAIVGPPAASPPAVAPAPRQPSPGVPSGDPLARVAAAMTPPPVPAPASTGKPRAEPPRADEHSLAAPKADATDIEAKTPASEPPVAGQEPSKESLVEIAATAELREPPQPQMQKIVRAPSMAASRPSPFGDGRSASLDLPLGVVPSKGGAAAMPGAEPPSLSGGGAISRTRRSMAAEAAPADGRSSEAFGPPGAGPSLGAKAPGGAPAHELTSIHPEHSGTLADRNADAPVDDVAARMSAPAAQSAWGYRPGEAMREAGFSPSESDVEMIQGLIKKLADEVNSADAHKLMQDRSREGLEAAAIDRSVGALRQAARNMHEPSGQARSAPTASGPAARAGQPMPPPAPSTPVRSGSVEPAARESAAAMRQPSASQSGKPQMDAPAPAAAEFDVEALMRRAKPIATMTSMPPPLPAAPNVMDQRSAPQPASAVTKAGPATMAASAAEAPTRAAEATRPSAQMPAGRATTPALGDVPIEDGLWDLDPEPRAVEQPEVPADAVADRLARISDAIEAGRIEVFLEPILDLEKQQARHFEVSVRFSDASGAEILPDDPAEAERPSGALPLLDSLRLKRTAEVARRLEERNKQGNVFASFAGPSLTADNFLTTFAETYEQQVQLAGQLVLTFTQADARLFRTPHWTMITEMRDLGFGFALRAVTDLDMDFELLANAGFKFVKLDADVFLSGLPTSDAIVPAEDLCKHLEKLGLSPVVEAIDDAEKREQVFAFGVRLGQGPLFGGARQIKALVANVGDRPAAA